ncbi:MAG: ABC transporter substrate-binding protein [Cetobacterium sp.]
MKKKLYLTAAALIAGTILTGCGDSNKKEEKTKPVLTVWAWDMNFNIPIMEEAAKNYNQKNPEVEIKVIDYARLDIEQKLHASLSAGAAKALPDIVLIEDYSAQKYLTSYPGNFADLTSKINFKDFADYKVATMTVENKVYGVPFDSGVTGMFYRTDYLEAAGYKAEDLQNITWDKFIEIGKDVKEKTGKYFMSGALYEDTGMIRYMMQSGGSWYFNQAGEIDFVNNEALKEAIVTLKKIKDADIIKITNGWGEWVGSVNSGDTATITTGAWIIGSIKSASDQEGKWAVAPIPKLKTKNSVNASNLGGSSWYILEKSKNKDVAIEFMKTIYGGDNNFYEKILVERGAIGTYLPSQATKAYEEKDKFFGGQKIYKDFGKWIQEIPAINYGTYVGEADTAIIGVLKFIIDGNISVEEGLEKAEKQLKSQLGK